MRFAGYFLIQGIQTPKTLESTGLPSVLCLPTTCFCTLYPGGDALSWVHTTQTQRQAYQKTLKLEDAGLTALQRWTEEHFDQGHLGWGDVFLSRDLALAFFTRYLQHLDQIFLISLGLSEHLVAQTEAWLAPTHPQEGPTGLGQALALQQPAPTDGESWGFDVLCLESSGTFHHFLCNGLEKDYIDHLGLSLNAHGRFIKEANAQVAADYTKSDLVGAEPGLWQPWHVQMHPLQNIKQS